ncbi:ribonuclease [Massilia sp. RP-1-19]|uniref:Ribonuclease n=1 Tax=Massilia polaris TaxID=2728846 RepID=A0A848HJK0_9BURK|nr:ribonuclease [Massilia polaris]NML61207.1 ribonuclease [Massilia polaris]
MHVIKILLVVVTAALGFNAEARRPSDAPGQFDYYAVALSWSPSYCATRNDPDQCAIGRRLGFVLHGLWPQHERGYPENCSTEKLPRHVKDKYSSLFPSERLAEHEWKKHGSCSGLDPAGYFVLSGKLKSQVAIPPAFQQPSSPVRVSYGEFVQAFKRANPKLQQYSVLPFCAAGGRFLREVHVCYNKRGESRSCSEGQIKRSYSSCRQESFVLQNVR